MLALTIVCGTLASCKTDNTKKPGGSTGAGDSVITTGGSTTDEVTTEDYDYKQDLPEADYDGADVVFAYVRNEYTTNFTADSDATDAYSQAVYERNLVTRQGRETTLCTRYRNY